MYDSDDCLMISGLQHVVFCERQVALIHVERLWQENFFTAQGHILHEKVDAGGRFDRGARRQTFDVPVVSLRLGLRGIADLVEWEGAVPYPVEYKRGARKLDDCDRVQLCAQALCLEEMHSMAVPLGAIFYGKTRKREVVVFDAALRAKTEAAVARFREIVETGVTPPAVYTKACESCSLNEWCLPKKTQSPKEGSRYLAACLKGDP
ncbi:MAG: CRISPR-associated protein Cas4 [Deltaproteobacteria bacterium HGW-Deltaproteobacteria-22]|nr:MAG: CRISPR-associated protein Cas4 [Deltaproteobacteria bacterium HGW-Deltaproteobacteria-22]